MGGLPRRATYMQKHTVEGVEKIVVDAGDFASAGSKHGEFKTDWMMRGMGELGYDAIAVGERDLQLGREELLEMATKYSLPLVCSNLIDTESKQLLVQPYVIVEKGDKSFFGLVGHSVKVGIFGVLSPKYLVPVNKPGEAPLKATDPIDASKRMIEELKSKGCSVIVALAHVSVPEAGQMAALGDLAAIVMGHSMTHLREPRFDNNAVIVQGGREGRYIGDIQIQVDPSGKVVSTEGEVAALSNTYADDPLLAAIVSEYKKALELQRFTPNVTSDAGAELFIGDTTCGSCHLDQLEQWKTTQHAHAFATLVDKNSHFDPECVGCHTLGYGRANGFKDAKTTPAMANVQCENCHGPGMAHFRFYSTDGKLGKEADAVMGTVAESVCTECHKDDHDPEFDYNKKVVAVTH